MSRKWFFWPLLGHQLSFHLVKGISHQASHVSSLRYYPVFMNFSIIARSYLNIPCTTSGHSNVTRYLHVNISLLPSNSINLHWSWEKRLTCLYCLSIPCPPEKRKEESHLLWVCGRDGRELSLLQILGTEMQDGIPPLTLLNSFPQQG